MRKQRTPVSSGVLVGALVVSRAQVLDLDRLVIPLLLLVVARVLLVAGCLGLALCRLGCMILRVVSTFYRAHRDVLVLAGPVARTERRQPRFRRGMTSMKSILVPVEDHDGMEPVLKLAVLVARRFSATIEGVPLGPDIAEMVAADFSMSGVIFDDRTRRAFLRDAGTTFEGFMDRAGVPRRGDAEPLSPSFGWSGEALVSPSSIGEIGRAYDLVVVGRPGSASHQPRRSTLEAALFDSGRPLLIVPPKMPATCGDTVAIAWNGSSETARTLAFALPLLVRARDVAILAVPGLRLPGPAEADIARNLRRHGVPARVIPVAEEGRTPARAFLEAASVLGADLIVKGGYTQSRIRQMFFGSVTADILAQADLPVFMAH